MESSSFQSLLHPWNTAKGIYSVLIYHGPCWLFPWLPINVMFYKAASPPRSRAGGTSAAVWGWRIPHHTGDGWVYLGRLSLVCVCVLTEYTERGKWHLNGLTASWELLFPFSSARLASSKEQGGVMQNCSKHVTFWQAQSSIHPVCYLYLLQEFFKGRGILLFMFFSLLFPEKN